MDKDPELITSIRYLARDTKNGCHILVYKICRKYGISKPGEFLHPDEPKTKLIFVISQLIYTIIALCHITLLYRSYYLSCIYLCFLFSWGTWNGATYYIEIFSKRYNLKFSVKEPSPPPQEDIKGETMKEEDEEEDDFVEALDNLDLNEPSNMELYNKLLENIVVSDSALATELKRKFSKTSSSTSLSDEKSINLLAFENNVFKAKINPDNEEVTLIELNDARNNYPQSVINYFLNENKKHQTTMDDEEEEASRSSGKNSINSRSQSEENEVPDLIADAAEESSITSEQSGSSESDKWEVVADKH